MYQINPLLKESKFNTILKPISSGVGLGTKGFFKGGVIGGVIGGAKHLINDDEDLDDLAKQNYGAYKLERRRRLKNRIYNGIKKGAAIGGTLGAGIGVIGGSMVGHEADKAIDILNKKLMRKEISSKKYHKLVKAILDQLYG